MSSSIPEFPSISPAESESEVKPQAFFGTKLVHGDHLECLDSANAVIPAISLSTTFKQTSAGHSESGFEYSRAGNPNRLALESLYATLELPSNVSPNLLGPYSPARLPPALAFSSGSAVTATVIQALVGAGNHVVSVADVYGGTFRYLTKVAPTFGVETTFVQMSSTNRENEEDRITRTISDAFRGNTKLVWIESPTNPTLEVVDIQLVAKVAHSKGALLVVDNTFASPYWQRPLALGADVVVHSSTKSVNGHSDVVGGALITNKASLLETLRFHQNSTGSIPSPFDCWLTIRGARTLELRSQRSATTALKIAEWLESTAVPNGWVSAVLYRGKSELAWKQLALEAKEWVEAEGYSLEKGFPYTGMLSLRLTKVDDQIKTTNKFLSALKVFTLAESLGGFESLANLPSLMTHASLTEEHRATLGIDDGLVRLSVGIEDSRDLIKDLEQALRAAFPA